MDLLNKGSDQGFGPDILVRFMFLCYIMPHCLFCQSDFLGSHGGFLTPIGPIKIKEGLTHGSAQIFWLDLCFYVTLQVKVCSTKVLSWDLMRVPRPPWGIIRKGSDPRFGPDILVRFVILCYRMHQSLFCGSVILGSYGGHMTPFLVFILGLKIPKRPRSIAADHS